jgi:4-hydroxybutyryl-CoA dehydratase/vinylacetyl-CoA-Delta-isomerase
MPMRTSNEYLDSLRDGRSVYYRGKRVDDVTRHEILRIPVKHASMLYEFKQKFPELAVYHDPEMGPVSAFYKIPRSVDDLLKRHELIKESTRYCNGIFNIVQAIGSDALFALFITASKSGDRVFHERVQKYYRYVVENDLATAVAQTDVKGDRSLRPHEQPDPDLYVRVVDSNDEGIIVCGAKAHTTQSVAANEIIFIPTRAMVEKDRDYAIAFAIPANTKGLKLVCRPVQEVEGLGREDAPISSQNLEIETLTILDHVFVPWERVFLFKDWGSAGELANTFATYHRFTAISYRSVMAELFIGAARLAARYNGIENAPHVREDIIEMILYREIMDVAAKAAAHYPLIDEKTGIAIPNPLYTNIAKLYSNKMFPNIVGALVDVAGGLTSTLPTTDDLNSPEIRNYLVKYLQGNRKYTGEQRFKLLRLVRELAGGPMTGYMMGLFIHAEGSVAASKIALYRDYKFERAEELVSRLAGVPP